MYNVTIPYNRFIYGNNTKSIKPNQRWQMKLKLKGLNTNKKNKFNQPPGTLNYTGEFTEEPFHGEIYLYDGEDAQSYTFNSIESLQNILKTPSYQAIKVKWINIIGLNHITEIEALGNLFNIAKLKLEDIVHVSTHSKVETNAGQIFSMMKMMYIEDTEIVSESLSIFKMGESVITFQETTGDIFDGLRARIINNNGIVRTRNADYLYYLLVDLLIDNYLKVLSGINSKIDSIEDIIIDSADVKMNDIYNLKKELLFLKTTVYPIRGLREVLQRSNVIWKSADLAPYLKDLNDHINQLIEEITSARELVNNLFETHMLNVNNDMNKVITTLTVFSAIFIPLSFLSGVFGMNFHNFPGLNAPSGIYFFIGTCIVIAVAMLSVFKIKKWF